MSVKTVLAIDDDTAILDLIRTTFDVMLNVTTLTAASGEEGLAWIAASHPSVVVVDLRMRGLSGAAVIRRLQNDPVTAAIPIIALTAGSAEQRDHAIELGARECLAKPFSPRLLADRVRAYLGPPPEAHSAESVD